MSNLNRDFHLNYAFKVGGMSHIGQSHLKKQMVNQDSFGVFEGENYAIICLADGHGSAIHYRSDRGSKFAIDVAHKVLKSFVDHKPLHDLNKSLHLIKHRIHRSWIDMCFDDMKKEPIKVMKVSRELHLISEDHVLETTGENIVQYKDKDIYLSDSEAKMLLKDPIAAYGTTLLASLMIKEGIILLQLGDGDMKLYYHKEPMDFITPSPLMFGNSTYSLSSRDALDHMQIVFLDTLPDFIFLSTDGIINSLEDEKDYQKLGFEMLKSFQESPEKFNEELSTLIERFALYGSGDDCSICYGVIQKNTNKKEF